MILLIGASHKTAPVSVREQLAVSQDQLRPLLHELHASAGISEVFCLSTCNRIELYAVTPTDCPNACSRAQSTIEQTLTRHHADHQRTSHRTPPHANTALHHAAPPSILPYLYRYTDRHAVRHLFRVTSSLDSLVVGESQVLGQVKRAFDTATDCGTLGPLLGRAIEWSLHVAKRVRSETLVGQGSVSVSSVAAQLANQLFDNLQARTVALVGAGTMAEAAARSLCTTGARLHIVNRNLKNAQSLAQKTNATPHPWCNLTSVIELCDVVITSTASDSYIITAPMITQTQQNRAAKNVFLIDIAVPRNIDPAVSTVPGVHLYDIDSLSNVANQSIDSRSKQARICERIIDEEAQAFDTWIASLHVTPAIVALRNRIDSVLQAELHRSLQGKLKHLDPAQRQAINDMLSAAVNKLSHEPTVRLKAAAASGSSHELVHAIRYLFEDAAPPNPCHHQTRNPSPHHRNKMSEISLPTKLA